MNENVGTIKIENAKILFRNFSGKEGKFNPAGKRNFCLVLPQELVPVLIKDGWNVKYLSPKEEGDEPKPYIQVAVSFDNIPPKIWMVTSRGKALLDEESVSALDWAEIINVDISVRPYFWSVSGHTGVKAYVKTMYVTIAEDEFEAKYADPDSVPF